MATLTFYAGLHLLLFVTDYGKYAYVTLVMAAAFLYMWIFSNTGGSVLLAMLLHASQGAVADFIPMFSGSESVLKELEAGRSVSRTEAAEQVGAE